MKYEIYIQEPKKSQKFCKKAIAEYEKRLSRYCKISCKFVKKEKRVELSAYERYRHEKTTRTARQSRTYLRKTQRPAKKWEGSGMKGVMFFVPEWNEEATDKFAELGTGPIEPLVLSDFTMSSNMTGMVLYEQIYRGYRILHNHPYHK